MKRIAQNLAFLLNEYHTTGLSPLFQAAQISLQSLSTCSRSTLPTNLALLANLLEGELNYVIQVINKDVEQDQPQY